MQKSQPKFSQIQKTDCLNTMAKSVVHDFNNFLTAILGNVNIIIGNIPKNSSIKKNVEQIESCTLRAIAFTNQIHLYCGKSSFVEKEFNISDLLNDMTGFLKTQVGQGINIKYHIADKLPVIRGDVAQIRQAITNLVSNAVSAFQDKKGTISVSTGMMKCDKAYLRNTYIDENLPEGRYLYIEISDTGCGMSSAVQAKIFDPFFTTNMRGKGMELAVVLGIVRAHKGAIKLQSEPKKGSTFRILLPS